MCLSVAIERPNDVLATGFHEGFEWSIVHNEMGFRCGYVQVPKDHPWYGKVFEEVDAEVHGGITFGEADKPCDAEGEDDKWWVGFDCAHAFDAPDPDLTRQTNVFDKFMIHGDVVRTQEYVEAECRSLCEQAKEAAA